MYKLVAIDLDGTMLNQYGIITEKTKKAISKVQEKGVEVMIASGRAITSVKRFSKEINSKKITTIIIKIITLAFIYSPSTIKKL